MVVGSSGKPETIHSEKHMALVIIEGWGGSGKSLLLSYLDSHSDLLALPVHDKLPYDLLKIRSSHLNTVDSDVRHIRNSLSSHGYYNIEYNAIRQQIPVLLSTKKDDTINVPFKFNFEQFEGLWKSDAITQKYFSREKLLDIIYTNFFKISEIHKQKSKTTKKMFVSLGDARSCAPSKFLIEYPNSKIIYVKRSVSELIGIRSNRQTPTGLAKGMFEKDFLSVMISAEVQKIIDYEHKITAAEIVNPNRVLILEFDTLFDDTTQTLNKVQKFLELRTEKLFPTMLGYNLGDETQNYGSQKNDSVRNLLSRTKMLNVTFFERIGRQSQVLNNFLLQSLSLVSFIIRALKYIFK